MRKSTPAKDVDTIRDDVQSLKKDLQELKSDLKGLVSSVKDSGHHRVNGTKDRVLESARKLEMQLNERIHDAGDVMKEKGQEFAEKAKEKVEQRPFSIVIGALLTGILIEKFLSRRS